MKKWLLPIVMIMVFLCLAGCQKDASSEQVNSLESQKYAQAQSLLAKNRYDEAAAIFDELGSYEEASKLSMYCKAASAGEDGDFQTAFLTFKLLGDFKDSAFMLAYYEACRLESSATKNRNNWVDWISAANQFDGLVLFRDSKTRAETCKSAAYQYAEVQENAKVYWEAINIFEALGDYSDAKTRILAARYKEGMTKRETQDWEGAIIAFGQAGDYSDAATQIPATRYAEGIAKQEADDWYGAVTAFKQAGDYSDAADQIKETRYLQARNLYENGYYIDAYRVYKGIAGYKDVDNLISKDSNLLTAHKMILFDFQTVGANVFFGAYEQDNNPLNGPEPIEWIVLNVQEEKALLLSKYGLDTKPYNNGWNNTTWEQCSLRAWLNNEFLLNAFNAEEQAAVLFTNVDNSMNQGYWTRTNGGENTTDQIFLLSYYEADWQYLFNNLSRRCLPTKYALSNGAWTTSIYQVDDQDAGVWWLRSPGKYQDCAMSVGAGGFFETTDAVAGNIIVRPAFWINLESDII